MSTFEPHTQDLSHPVGCPGCIAKMIELEVTKQVNEVMGKFLEKIEKMMKED